jgi:hypothetical protein
MLELPRLSRWNKQIETDNLILDFSDKCRLRRNVERGDG